MKTVTVKLGGKEYSIAQKPMGQMVKWRKRLGESRTMLIFQTLDHVVAQFTSIAQDAQEGGVANVDLGQALGLTRILPAIVEGLLNSIDEVWALVFEYAPDIAKDREWLEENAYDEEGIEAFRSILSLAFPISALWAMVSGRRAPATNTNSPTRNGATGLSPSGPVRKNVKTSS